MSPHGWTRPAWFLLMISITIPDVSAAEPANAHVVLIGGFDSDPTAAQLNGTARRGEGTSGMFQLRNDLRREKISAEYFNWNGTPPGDISAETPPGPVAIVTHIREHLRTQPATSVRIVGNSWGGHTAWEVCNALCDEPGCSIPLVVFLDPSSAGRPNSKRPAVLPKNVTTAVQYASRSAVVWAPWQNEPRVRPIDLADPKQGFLRPGGPPYSAIFNPNSHVGAEWDDKIHLDIRKRLTAR
jgi:pimeloyl-ACP methyl ester carboxylesterase